MEPFHASLSARRAWIEISLNYKEVLSWVVALRKESVDRNVDGAVSGSGDYVALRKESVDRNVLMSSCTIGPPLSLSARRAWIEIFTASPLHVLALSLSARRAWIEMPWLLSSVSDSVVALRKESVDRNGFGAKLVHSFLCRSPQGERG